MDRTKLRGICLATIAAGGIAAAAAPSASAHDVDFSEGTTKLTLSKGASTALKALGVRASGTSYGITGGVYSLHELTDGGGGTLRHTGTLTLRKGDTTVRLRSFTISVRSATKRRKASGRLSALVGNRRVNVASLDLATYKESEKSAGFNGAGVLLSRTGAAALNGAFDTMAFTRGLRLGTLSSRGMAAPLAITGGSTRVDLAPAAANLLAGKGASLTALANATGTGTAASPFTFPIVTSRFDYASFKGAVRHTGGLRYTAPAGKPIAGRQSLDLTGFRAVYTDALRIVTGSGTPVFELRFEDDSKLRQSPRLTMSKLSVFFTRQAAALVAPTLGLTPAALRKTRLGTAAVSASYGKVG